MIGKPLEELGKYCRIAAAEGAVLLKNEGKVLPLKAKERIAVFGRCQIEYYRSGTGSGGAVNVPYVKNILDELRKSEALLVNEKLAKKYESWIQTHPFDNGGGGWACEPWFQKEMPLTQELVKEAREESEVAIFIVGRTAGEDKDHLELPGSYYFTDEELENLKAVCAEFSKVVVLLNVSNIMDMNWMDLPEVKNQVQGVLYIWQGGMEGGAAVCDLLIGKVSPSGKLSDTIAYQITDYPAYHNFGKKDENIYQEDIYIGYRYFETFCPNRVRFAFGFGLSYTDFLVETKECKEAENKQNEIQVKVAVTNTGSYSGKEVVQIYVEAPQGKLGKPAKVLVAFAKTKNLLPGETQLLSFVIPFYRFASYDDSGITGKKSCYVLEEGVYHVLVGNSVKNVAKAGDFFLEDMLVLEQLQEAMGPQKAFERLKPAQLKTDGSYEKSYEITPVQSSSMSERIQSNLPKDIEYTGDKGIKLIDVARGEASLQQFVAQFNAKDLAVLVRGEGMSSPKVTPGTASAFGGIGDRLYEYGIPVACCADGPSGIRMESGLLATQLPIGTLLACSFNLPMMEELYVLEGKELYRNQIDTLLGPGMNLHRHPLNGRNFEYFSEDPFLTGSFAKAAVIGIRKGGSHATIKHFAANNQELSRMDANSIVSERALRELYLKGFEIAVKEGGATSIMTSYNPINGHWSASNYDLCTTILREEWGYKGLVMTDWWAKVNDCVEGGASSHTALSQMICAQNDIYMVVNNNGAEINSNGDDIEQAIREGRLSVGQLQRCACNILQFILNAPVMKRPLAPSNPIQKMKSAAALELEQDAVSLEDQKELYLYGKKQIAMKVEKAGIYHVIIKMRSPLSNLSQSSTNVKMNDSFFMTIQTCGTDNRWITEKKMRVSLEEGYYTLVFEETKPGIELEYIAFEFLTNP